MGTLLAGTPPIKIGGEWRPQGKGPHDDVEIRVAYSLLHAESLAWFLSGVTLRELRLSVLPGGYRVMLKGERKAQHRVAFFHADTWRDGLTIAATSLDTNTAVWWEDLYPPKA